MENSIGLQMYTLRNQMAEAKTALEVYQKVKAAGYDTVQPKITHGMTPAQLAAVLKDAGLRAVSFNGAAFGGVLGILANPKAAIEGAHALGVEILDIPTLFAEYRDSEEGYRQFGKALENCGKLVAGEGLRISYHPHALEFHKFPSGARGIDAMADASDPALVHFCLDCHWMQAGGVDQVGYIKKLKGRQTMIHFKDYGIGLGTGRDVGQVIKTFEAIGEGNIDWKPIVAACREVGIRDYIVEQDYQPRDAYDCIASSARYMRETLGLPG